MRDEAFKKFVRIAGNQVEGTGLGLAIVKKIAALHGATLSIKDGLENKGLSISFEFYKN